MDSFCVQIPATAPAEVAAQLADAAAAAAAGHDDAKLRRALVGGGAAKAVAALLLALSSRSSPPAGGVFLRGVGGGGALLCAYYGVLAAVALFGGLEVAVGFWVAGDPDRRRGWGRRVIWVSVVPLVVVAGLGGFAVLK